MPRKGYRLLVLVLSTLLTFWLLGGTVLAAQVIHAYTTLDEEVARGFFQAFEKQTGVQVQWVRLSTGETLARIEAEKKNPQVSIWVGGVGLDHITAKNKGLTIPYDSPNAKDLPANFRDSDHYWTGMYAGPLCFVSNTALLKQYNIKAPTSWADLVKPEYKGRLEMANPNTSGTAYNVIATLVQIMGEDKAFEYLQKLDKNVVQYTKSGSAPGKSAAIGEITVGIGYAHDQVRLISQGYPLVITFPSEGTGYEVASISLIKGGPETELAKKLYDWALSDSAAKVFSSFFLAPFRDVPLAKGAIPIKKVKTINQNDEWAGTNQPRLLEKWNELIYSKR